MKKDFAKWHKKKIIINDVDVRPFFHEREIWFCHLGENVGFEQDGSGDGFLRPVVIVRKMSDSVFFAMPLSRTQKTGKYYFTFTFDGIAPSTALLSQFRLLDAKRLGRCVGRMSEADLHAMMKKFKTLLP